MVIKANSLPDGNLRESTVIHNTIELGRVAREQRKRLSLIQLDIAGMANTGNRFIVELEQGKPTVQLQKVLDILDLLGLEMVIRHKAPGAVRQNAPGAVRQKAPGAIRPRAPGAA